jgi:hypothetical protein
MKTIKDHFNRNARPLRGLDFIALWALYLTLLELSRKFPRAFPHDIPPPRR